MKTAFDAEDPRIHAGDVPGSKDGPARGRRSGDMRQDAASRLVRKVVKQLRHNALERESRTEVQHYRQGRWAL